MTIFVHYTAYCNHRYPRGTGCPSRLTANTRIRLIDRMRLAKWAVVGEEHFCELHHPREVQ